MLGEKHRLIDDFPEFAELIAKLNNGDKIFAETNQQYNKIDEEIRNLELGGTPIGDNEMHRMKQQRAAMKDKLYQCLVDVKS